MGGCWDKTKAFLSSFLVYDTVSIVRIKDKRLAILHYACMIGIAIYIFIYTLYINQEYYKYEAPVGTVRINPMAPPERKEAWNKIEDLPYCLTENRTHLYGFPLLKCKYYDSSIDVFPQAVDSSIAIATRIKFSVQNTTNTDFDTPDTTWNDEPGTNDTYYLADVERFTLQIDHTFFGPNVGVQDNARNWKGYIRYDPKSEKHDPDEDVKLCYPKVETVGEINKTNILSVCTLLRAAEIDIDKQSVLDGESIRNSGAIILVFLDYQNSIDYLFRPNDHYTVRAKMIDNTEYKAVQAVYTKKLIERTIYNRHGLHFVFLQTGKLVTFDFQVLLLSLVSGMGMFAFSTTIVDLISTKVLGNKDVVSNLKYKTTPNLTQFSDEELNLLASKLRRTQEQELAINKDESSVSLREPLVDRETDE